MRATENGMELFHLNREWANRPDDQRFLNIYDLRESVANRKAQSWTTAPPSRSIKMALFNPTNPTDDFDIGIEAYDPTTAQTRALQLNNWSFSQLCQLAGGFRSGDLRKLPAELIVANLQWLLEKVPARNDVLVYAQTVPGEDSDESILRALTSTTYGRIYDLSVVDKVIPVVESGPWTIPASSYTTKNPKRATTLYASDRDIFLCYVDVEHPIDIGNGEILYRGFMVSNSEVGDAKFVVRTFLYREICDNRIVWGAQNVVEVGIRHTSGAPERFEREAGELLARYANDSTADTVKQLKAAQAYEIPKAAEPKGVLNWLRERGFTQTVARAAIDRANEEEGESRSLYNIINGITAYARSIPHTDVRVDLEAKAGALMRFAKV